MSLSSASVKNAKPKEKDYKLSDSGGMFLLAKKNGSKYWRLKYRFSGKEKLLALGVYPDISLAEARERRDQARNLLANDADPGEVKKATKQAGKTVSENSFEFIAREWLARTSTKWVPSYLKNSPAVLNDTYLIVLARSPLLM